jgi:hypothetical protein
MFTSTRSSARLLTCAAFGALLASPSSAAQVAGFQKISSTQGGLTGELDDGDGFGSALASLGDLDGDGVAELAVGAAGDDDGATDAGAVWILFPNPDGSVRAQRKISATSGGLVGPLAANDLFGRALASLGDLDGDGVVDLAVGAPVFETGGATAGAVWVLFLASDGSVAREVEIGAGAGGFGGALSSGDRFGACLAAIGDLDDDGVVDLAVGAPRDDDGGPARGAAWILFLESDGTVKAEQKISDTAGGFQGALEDLDDFGFALAGLGDLDGDGTEDLAAGVPFADGLAVDEGAAWVLFLEPDGTVASEVELAPGRAGFGALLGPSDQFGSALALVGDRDGDGRGELAVGSPGDLDGLPVGDAVWLLQLSASGTVRGFETISRTRGCFGGLAAPRLFGTAIAALGDVDGDGVADLAASDRLDADGGPGRGAAWVLFLRGAVAASETARLGNPPNPAAFLPGRTSAPVVGGVWDPRLDHTSFAPGATADFVLVDLRPPINVPSGRGTLLCNVPPPAQRFFGPPGADFSLAIPNDCSLLGLAVCTQGGSIVSGTFQLANALDLVIGSF